MVELLAAIPSVVLGLWGILVFGPWVAQHLEPWLQSWFGFLPDLLRRSVAGRDAAGRARADDHDHPDHLGHLPRAVQPRAARSLGRLAGARVDALGGDPQVAIPYAAPGISAAVLLGLGRAFGEAIAVTQVIGGGNSINVSLFPPADTLASRIAAQYQGARSTLEVQSLLYLGAILLVISLITNVSRS